LLWIAWLKGWTVLNRQSRLLVIRMTPLALVGSQIRGASTTAALPVAVFNQEEIRTTGAVNGDDLLRTIPQMGDVLVSPANNAQTSNSARGDVNSINLRSLGVGNTLVLLNGRRIVQHQTPSALIPCSPGISTSTKI